MQSFNEKQVSRILHRAAELQTGDEGVAPGLTLDELRNIAAEVGIDPRFIEQAAFETQRPAPKKSAFSAFGTPPRLSDERVLTHPVDEDEWGEMVDELRRTYGQVGTVTGAGHTRAWSFGDRRSPAAVTVSLTQRRGRTFVTAQRNLHRAIGLTFGPGSAPLLVFSILLATGQILPMGVGFNLLAAAVLLLTGYFALRTLAGHVGQKERRKMTGVLDRIERIAGESEALRAPEAAPATASEPLAHPATPPLLDPTEAPEAVPGTHAPRTRTR